MNEKFTIIDHKKLNSLDLVSGGFHDTLRELTILNERENRGQLDTLRRVEAHDPQDAILTVKRIAVSNATTILEAQGLHMKEISDEVARYLPLTKAIEVQELAQKFWKSVFASTKSIENAEEHKEAAKLACAGIKNALMGHTRNVETRRKLAHALHPESGELVEALYPTRR